MLVVDGCCMDLVWPQHAVPFVLRFINCTILNAVCHIANTVSEPCRRCPRSPIARRCLCLAVSPTLKAFAKEGFLFSRGIRTSCKTMTTVKYALHIFFHVVALPFRVVTVLLRACCFSFVCPPSCSSCFLRRCVEVVSHRLLVRRRSWCPVVVCVALVCLGF